MYSSRAHPESSSLWECLWGSEPCGTPRGTPFDSSLSEGSSDKARFTLPPKLLEVEPPGPKGFVLHITPPLWSSRGHLQFRHTFLQQKEKKRYISILSTLKIVLKPSHRIRYPFRIVSRLKIIFMSYVLLH